MALKSGNKFPKRGEVYWVDLDPTQGGETQKTRPGLIISNDVGNEFSKMIMIAPITSKVTRIYPTESEAMVGGKKAKIMLHQCRAIDKSRLSKKICEISPIVMLDVERAIKVVFALG